MENRYDNRYDIIVIGAGPAGAQAAISAAHQMRHVLVIDAGKVSQKKGRAYWSKSVAIEDAPVFTGVAGGNFIKALHKWLESRAVQTFTIAGKERKVGIEIKGGVVLKLTRQGDWFEAETSVSPLKEGIAPSIEHFYAKAVVIASGFEDLWPDIEVDKSARRMYQRYQTVFRYAGNRKGWHVCIRCDGHLHLDRSLAIVGVGDYIYETAHGAQDFTDKISILTNGRPHGMSEEVIQKIKARKIEIIEEKIEKHIGKGTELLGFLMADGRELFFDGFFVDEGLVPNTGFLKGWDVKISSDGLLIADEDSQLLDNKGEKVPGLFAAGDIVAGQRKLIATAFGMGQNAGLAASDSLREYELT